ncbi:protein LTO1 homolog [Lutzomyia longipalpis]|uniref:protein LTO1 homolog n=1 Tax=Lutzomyia longipalpis TaxID=7200 RepID=UPI002484052F|nr:protein LTO1 homolog [Lutzomyia longipalpis]
MDNHEKDINDVFDDIALAEDKINQEGYEEGFTRGVTAGNTEAYHLGYHRGAEFGAELGYYMGIVEAFKDNKEDKVVASLGNLRESLENFPKFNDTNCDFGHEIQRIRGQFRKVCALLKFKSNFSSSGDLSF